MRFIRSQINGKQTFSIAIPVDKDMDTEDCLDEMLLQIENLMQTSFVQESENFKKNAPVLSKYFQI